MKLHHLCCVSITTYIFPVMFYCKRHQVENIACKSNFFLSLLALICSNLFWINPIKNNIYHKIDGIVAKVTYSHVVIYTTYVLNNINNKKLSKKYLYEYYGLNAIVIILFLLSSYYSSKQWCCTKHIFFCVCFHMVGMISTSYAYTSLY